MQYKVSWFFLFRHSARSIDERTPMFRQCARLFFSVRACPMRVLLKWKFYADCLFGPRLCPKCARCRTQLQPHGKYRMSDNKCRLVYVSNRSFDCQRQLKSIEHVHTISNVFGSQIPCVCRVYPRRALLKWKIMRRVTYAQSMAILCRRQGEGQLCIHNSHAQHNPTRMHYFPVRSFLKCELT